MIHKSNFSELLRSIGSGQPIAAACKAIGISREEFDELWRKECHSRVPSNSGQLEMNVQGKVRADHDRWGIPYIYATNDVDLFFTLGYLTASDRLFQIDYLRRKAAGRLAEVLGNDALDSDVLYRTLGLAQIAEAEWQSLSTESREILQAYSDGINAWLDTPHVVLPIEFDLLDYHPECWRPQSSLAILNEFRWYLTGRLPVIVVPELMKRQLGDGPLYRAALVGEADDESILWSGEYAPSSSMVNFGPGGDGGVDTPGSNNWVLSANRSQSGFPLLSGDPHLPFSALSIWYEVRFKGGTFDVAGATLAGFPGVMIGRTPRIAWGMTNNICSQRDLYQEQIQPGTLDKFLYDGKWEPAIERQEIIKIKGSEPIKKRILHSRNGPIVDEILPNAARDTGPVALRWVGQQTCGLFDAMLAMNRARTVNEFFETTRSWCCPTWNFECADIDGNIGMQTVGRIPNRPIWERGYRAGWDPQHQWAGFIARENMPRLINPKREFIVTANNRVAPDDYPIWLGCTASSGHRARRMRNEIERKNQWSLEDCQKLQHDVLSLRAAECIPPLLTHLHDLANKQTEQAVAYLRSWDFHSNISSIAASIFNIFFQNWCYAVALERLKLSDVVGGAANEVAKLAADRLGAIATELLADDPQGWFHRNSRAQVIVAVFESSLDELSNRLGSDMSQWQWGRLHTLLQPHYLSNRGELGMLFDQNGMPVPGDGTTVCNIAPNSKMAAYFGPGYRSNIDLGDKNLGMHVVNSASASGNVGSPHYNDQLDLWLRGDYRYMSLNPDHAAKMAVSTLNLKPTEKS